MAWWWVRMLLALCLASWLLPAGAQPVRLGVLAWLGEDRAAAQWAPLLDALASRLPAHSLHARYLDLDAMDTAVARGELDFVITNPGHYVALEARHGVSRIATQQIAAGHDSAHAVAATVIVPATDSTRRRLADLRDARLAMVTPQAFGGYQVIWGELKRAGVDPETGALTLRPTGYPMTRVVDALRAGQADAGVLRACLLEALQRAGQVRPGEFRVLSPQHHAGEPCQRSSPIYPGWAFAAAHDTPPALSRAVLLALLALPDTDDVTRWGVPADYHPVHDMLRELQIPPYDFLRQHRLENQVRRYWPWAAGVVALLLAWLAYTVRVEALVQRRTRELSAALTARDQLAERVHAHQREMDHLSRLSVLGELSGSLAHELNQPLATIGNYARSLKRRQANGQLDAAALIRAADEIASESERAAGVLAGIREFARKRARVREPHALATLTERSLSLFRGMLAHAPAITWQCSAEAAEAQVLADPLQIQQVLLNLLKNACDAQQAAGREQMPIVVSLQRDGARLALAVRDHGNGLDLEAQGRLFEPFFTTKPDGLGLGLSICKTIAEAHGGELSADIPADGPGLCLWLRLPCLENPPA